VVSRILPHSAYDQGADAYFLVVGEPQVGRERSNAINALDPVALDVHRGKCRNGVRYRREFLGTIARRYDDLFDPRVGFAGSLCDSGLRKQAEYHRQQAHR
jgi:hypothetical protein